MESSIIAFLCSPSRFVRSCQTSDLSDLASVTAESINTHLVFIFEEQRSDLDCLSQLIRTLGEVQNARYSLKLLLVKSRYFVTRVEHRICILKTGKWQNDLQIMCTLFCTSEIRNTLWYAVQILIRVVQILKKPEFFSAKEHSQGSYLFFSFRGLYVSVSMV